MLRERVWTTRHGSWDLGSASCPSGLALITHVLTLSETSLLLLGGFSRDLRQPTPCRDCPAGHASALAPALLSSSGCIWEIKVEFFHLLFL
ncbi:hypothetical protein GRJ2_000067000 [Grus japonensis]|uniref:Uncharacterized protein n=1 Tax=Grus japonensis TaxID=30415 RepID=A0ABC9VTH2_GRUJA